MSQIYSKIFGRKTRGDSISISSAQSNNDETMGSALGIEQADTSQGTSNFPNARGNNQCVGNQTINTHIDTVHNYGASTPSIPDDFNYGLPNNVMDIIGREEEMKQLEEWLNKDRRVAIVGMGGVGKTTLAYNFAKKWITQSRISVVINSETNETVTGCIKGLAACLKVSNAGEMPPVELMKDIVRILNNKKVLFVFDNVEDYEAVRDYLPPKDNHDFKVLFTSQTSKFETFKEFHLKVLTGENSLKLITSRLNYMLWNSAEKMKDVNALLDIMKGLPLALLQAAAHIQLEYSCSSTYKLKQYILTYKYHLLDSKKECPYSNNSADSYKKTVYWAVKMNIDLMKKDKDLQNYIKHASKVLYSVCHLKPDSISKTLLSGMVENEDILDKVIYILIKYSLCDKYEQSDGTYLTAHRLILEILGKLLNNEDNEYKKDIFVNLVRAVIRCNKLGDHKVFILPFLRNKWLYEAFKLEINSTELINNIKDSLGSYADTKFNVSPENLTLYHYAAYVGIPEVFANIMTSTDETHSDNIMSLEQIYEERQSSIIKNVNKYVISENDGRELVVITDYSGRHECLRKLLLGGAPATDAVNTLCRAADDGDTIFVGELLDRGAPPNSVNRWGETPLYVAVRAGNVDLTKMLFSKGASVNTVNVGGWTPLHAAVWYGRVECVTWLLANKANAAARDNLGGTPLEMLLDKHFSRDNCWLGDNDEIFKEIRNKLQKVSNTAVGKPRPL